MSRNVRTDNIYWNESTTPLTASGVFTGTARDVGDAQNTFVAYSSFNAFAYADQNGTLRIDISNDGVTWRRATADLAVTATTPINASIPVTTRFARAVFTNGATGQGAFMLNTSYTTI